MIWSLLATLAAAAAAAAPLASSCSAVNITSKSNQHSRQPASHFQACTLAPATAKPFDAASVATMRSLMLQNVNIQGKGGVVASPDTMVNGGGSYYYAWARDEGLTMRCILRTFPNATKADQQFILQSLATWANWVVGVQAQQDPNGIDVRAEPKFNLPNGDVFSGGWCRPQTDGPAIRATTLMLYSNILLDMGSSSIVNNLLWTGSGAKNGGAIAYDLDYVAANWQSQSCDLWEEIRSDDIFWNLVHFKMAMEIGAQFASRMGDQARAATYGSQVKPIAQKLSKHWNGAFLFETMSAGRELDSAVIGGLKNAFDLVEYNVSLPFGSASSAMIAATIQQYNAYFCSSYVVNQKLKGTGGMLYGRYEGDHYGGGNPWIIGSAQLAHLGASLPQSTFDAWAALLDASSQPKTPAQLATALAKAADGALQRIESLVVSYGYHLSEQLDRNTGAELSATDLTWSYAAVLDAVNYRENYWY